MKKLFLMPIFLFLIIHNGFGQTVFELKPAQSMSITGKGPGQDAAYNPYSESNSIAVVENIGRNPFTVRLQEKGKVIEIILIEAGTTKKIKLLKGYELYFDSEEESKAKLDFKKLSE